MAFPSAPHSAAQSFSSPSHEAAHQVSDSKTHPSAEKKLFSGTLSSITSLFTKTKNAVTGGNSIPLESRARAARPPVGRDDLARRRRGCSVDMFECVDKMEQDFTTFQVSSYYN